jgi:signal transduction histidine kinase
MAEQQWIQEAEAQKKRTSNQIKIICVNWVCCHFLFVAIFLYINNRQKSQLIQSEKMASLAGPGKKEPTDINALADEYLRLSYHGLRAKDKNFNAEMKMDFDENIGKINIIPQDIGRVLLNLFNNAFYAVNEQKSRNLISYQPTVCVTSKKSNDKIEIIVRDNGNGIPQKIADKTFQPFFTTKPTGEGTELGLSLAYDIITKEHNGTIKVESKKGDGSKFVIQLLSKEN